MTNTIMTKNRTWLPQWYHLVLDSTNPKKYQNRETLYDSYDPANYSFYLIKSHYTYITFGIKSFLRNPGGKSKIVLFCTEIDSQILRY